MIDDNYNSEQLDKLVNEIEGRLNDFDAGITDKDETIKSFADLVINCVKTAVDSSRVEPEVKVQPTNAELSQLLSMCKTKILLYYSRGDKEYIGGVPIDQLEYRIDKMQERLSA